jgi:flotillin
MKEVSPALRVPEPTSARIERYEHGWRSGKPIEDPDKLKRWGYVGAKPSEYLVCTRDGVIDHDRSGQGVRVFKWPRDSIAIVPTTLQRIDFVADQITRERIGVEVAGIAVYRIAEPELAFRVLNFTYGEAASEKLGATLREMFVGAARRLIANLSLDECLTRRKETIARFLMDEIAPVVSGEGSPEDRTTAGWGVVIDTIEIQQVRIQSAEVFAHLQAPYRAEIAGRAELAELDRKRQVAEVAATAARRNAELARDRAMYEIAIAEEQRRTQAAAEVAAAEAEAARSEALHRNAALELEHEHTLRRREAEVALDLRRRDAETRELESQLDAAALQRSAALEQELAQVRTLQLLVQALPQIAAALATRAETLNVTSMNGAGLDTVPAAIAQLLALAKGFGLQIP